MNCSEKPKYVHDCDECFFLGNYEWNNCEWDLYTCVKTMLFDGRTFIARFGNEGEDYISGGSDCIGFFEGGGHPLWEAYRRFNLQEETNEFYQKIFCDEEI